MAYALVAVVLVIAIFHDSSSAHAAVTVPSGAAKEFLEAHNEARAGVGVGGLRWSEQLANATRRLVRYQRNKKGCETAELRGGNKYGANQSWRSGAMPTPRTVVDGWVEEKNYYNYGSNSCVPNHKCGLYTQVVWNTSLELGCAQAACKGVKDKDVTLTICFYNPPGNYQGERPY